MNRNKNILVNRVLLVGHVLHTVKILGFRQKKLYKGFYAKNVVPYTYENDI